MASTRPAVQPIPSSFVDDITVEVYFKHTGSVFENTYTVATPAGLGQLLRDKEWDILYSPEIFIVNRYDLKLIRETILEHIMDDFRAAADRRQVGTWSGLWGLRKTARPNMLLKNSSPRVSS